MSRFVSRPPRDSLFAGAPEPDRRGAEADRPELRFWLAQMLFWGVVGLTHGFVLVPYLRPDVIFSETWLVVIVRVVTGFLVSTGLRTVYRYLAQQTWPQRRILARGVLVLFLAAFLEYLLFQGGLLILVASHGPFKSRSHFAGMPLTVFHRIDILTVWSLLFIAFFQAEKTKSAELRAAEAESTLRTSELHRLEAQLQPHFLFNALTAILACRHNPDDVARVTNGLSEHLRYCLGRQRLLEPLGREIDALEEYLHVQRARFGPNLECTIACTPEARAVPIPPMIVSPLLDNALKHGPVSSPRPLRIAVDCRVVDGMLQVIVTNTGAWIEEGSRGRVGTGLANLRERLKLYHLEQAVLTCETTAAGVQACVTLPLSMMTSKTSPEQRL
ncbi:MAG: sensor histidine kinase [Planctomycetaceae bacterium]|jgi:signal transduction histidine kinase